MRCPVPWHGLDLTDAASSAVIIEPRNRTIRQMFEFGCYLQTPARARAAIPLHVTGQPAGSSLPPPFGGVQVLGRNVLLLSSGISGFAHPEAAPFLGITKIPDKSCSISKRTWGLVGREPLEIFEPFLQGCFLTDVYTNPDGQVSLLVPAAPCPTGPQVLFSDDFDDGDLEGWHIAFGGSSNWAAINGQACQVSPGQPLFTNLTFNGPLLGEFDIILPPNFTGGAAITPRFDETNATGYAGVALVIPSGGIQGLVIQIMGEVAVFDSVNLASVPRRLSLNISDTNISLIADGVEVLTVPKAFEVAEGSIGMGLFGEGSESSFPLCFDNVTLLNGNAPSPEPSEISSSAPPAQDLPYGCYQATPATTQTNFTLKFAGREFPSKANATRHLGFIDIQNQSCGQRITQAFTFRQTISTNEFPDGATPRARALPGCYVTDVYSNAGDNVRILVPRSPCPTGPPPGGALFSDDFNDGDLNGWVDVSTHIGGPAIPPTGMIPIGGKACVNTGVNQPMITAASFSTSTPTLEWSPSNVPSGGGTFLVGAVSTFAAPFDLALYTSGWVPFGPIESVVYVPVHVQIQFVGGSPTVFTLEPNFNAASPSLPTKISMTKDGGLIKTSWDGVVVHTSTLAVTDFTPLFIAAGAFESGLDSTACVDNLVLS